MLFELFDPSQDPFILVHGLGLSGRATYTFLKAKGLRVIAYDPRVQESSVINELNQIPFDALDCVIQSPGIPSHAPYTNDCVKRARYHQIPFFCDMDVFQYYKDPQIPCIGITGTNGKSTTTALVTHILQQCGYKTIMGGNIGVPVLTLLEQTPANYYVIELSSYQLELIQRLDLTVAILLNIGQDHLDRHETVDNYTRIKEKIFSHATHRLDYRRLDYRALDEGKHETLPTIDHPFLKGAHNQQNIQAAQHCVTALGFSADQVLPALMTFKGLPHRMEVCYQDDTLTIINDSKATNGESAVVALQTLLSRQPSPIIHWIVGGRAKSDGLVAVTALLPSLTYIYLIGESMPAFAAYLTEIEYKGEIYNCHDVPTALRKALDNIRRLKTAKIQPKSYLKHEVILFSPACASYDQFDNFEHRGDFFKQCVATFALKIH